MHPDKVAALARYADLVRKWNPAINLVASRDLRDFAARHVEDGLQVHAIAPERFATWLDLGSGGGLPGIVVAVMRPEPRAAIHLVEADRRKAEFLRTAARELGLTIRVHDTRIETLPPMRADIVSARALAPLDRLFQLAVPHGHEDTTYIFPKGRSFETEIAEARRSWHFEVTAHRSRSDPDSAILEIGKVAHV